MWDTVSVITTRLLLFFLHMEITHHTPGSYRTERKPATVINLFWIVSTIALFSTSLLFVPDTQAKNHDYCNKMFDSLFFQDVPATIHAECKNRFVYNTNQIKASMRSFTLNLR